MDISKLWDFSEEKYKVFNDSAESLGAWMPIPIINAPDLTKGDNSKPSSFVAFNFIDILNQSLLKHTRAHALSVNSFGSYDWITMNLEFDFWVAWLSPGPVRKTLEFLIPRFCYNRIEKYNSSKKIVDNSNLILKDSRNCQNFWDHIIHRFDLRVDGTIDLAESNKIFTVGKVYYATSFSTFYREFSFVVENDYVSIISHLLVKHRDLDPIRVATPFIPESKLFESWKFYYPLCQEMMIWFFEFYIFFDQLSWEIPLETIGFGNVNLMPGFIQQDIGPKGILKGVSISKMDVEKRLLEGMVEKERNWKDKQLLVKKEKEDFKIDSKVGAVCVVCSRPAMLCRCGEISKKELDFGNDLINKSDRQLNKQPEKVEKLRESLRISDLDFAKLLSDLKNKQSRLKSDENQLKLLKKAPSDFLPKNAILEKDKDWEFKKNNSQDIPSLIIEKDEVKNFNSMANMFEVDKLNKIHVVPVTPILRKDNVNNKDIGGKDFLKKMNSLDSKIKNLEKDITKNKIIKDEEISQLVKEPFSFNPSQNDIRINSVSLVKEVNPFPPLNPNPPVPVPPSSGLIELSGDERWTEVVMTKSMPNPNKVEVPFPKPSNKEIDNDNNNNNNNNNSLQSQKFIPSIIRSSDTKPKSKNNINWSNSTPSYVPSSNQPSSSSSLQNNSDDSESNSYVPSMFPASLTLPKVMAKIMSFMPKGKSYLTDSIDFPDVVENKTVHAFSERLFKCDGGFYAFHQITEPVYWNTFVTIIIGFIIAICFTLVMNAYWPILTSIYKDIKKLLARSEKERKELDAKMLAPLSFKTAEKNVELVEKMIISEFNYQAELERRNYINRLQEINDKKDEAILNKKKVLILEISVL
jgi:hypothetical protein